MLPASSAAQFNPSALITDATRIRNNYAKNKMPNAADVQSFQALATVSPYESLKAAILADPAHAAIQLAELAIFQTTPNAADIINNIRNAICPTNNYGSKEVTVTVLKKALQCKDNDPLLANAFLAGLRTPDGAPQMMQHLPENNFEAVGYQILAMCLQNPNVPPAESKVIANIQQLLTDLAIAQLQTTASSWWEMPLANDPAARQPPASVDTTYTAPTLNSSAFAALTTGTEWTGTAPSGSGAPSLYTGPSIVPSAPSGANTLYTAPSSAPDDAFLLNPTFLASLASSAQLCDLSLPATGAFSGFTTPETVTGATEHPDAAAWAAAEAYTDLLANPPTDREAWNHPSPGATPLNTAHLRTNDRAAKEAQTPPFSPRGHAIPTAPTLRRGIRTIPAAPLADIAPDPDAPAPSPDSRLR